MRVALLCRCQTHQVMQVAFGLHPVCYELEMGHGLERAKPLQLQAHEDYSSQLVSRDRYKSEHLSRSRSTRGIYRKLIHNHKKAPAAFV